MVSFLGQILGSGLKTGLLELFGAQLPLIGCFTISTCNSSQLPFSFLEHKTQYPQVKGGTAYSSSQFVEVSVYGQLPLRQDRIAKGNDRTNSPWHGSIDSQPAFPSIFSFVFHPG